MSHRAVLLGASNLTNGFSLVLRLLSSGLAGPVEVHAAHGHGRSYGQWSRVLHRGLPGISTCALWEQINGCCEDKTSTVAVLTDVGNDLIYGVPVERIIEWVESCLERLREQDAEVVMTLLPMASLEQLSAWRYRMTQALFFPGRRSPWDEMLSRAVELNARLWETGLRYGAVTVEPPGEWYGFDPIHIRMRERRRAWRQILSHWPAFAPAESLRFRTPGKLRCLRYRPAERRLFGKSQSTPQPVLQSESATLHLY